MSDENKNQNENEVFESQDATHDDTDFLNDPEIRKEFQDFVIETYKRFKSEKLNEIKSRMNHEAWVDSNKMEPHHIPGNITPIMGDVFNMHDAEQLFRRGLKQTKKELVRSVDDRVEEINRLLAGIGGFSSQLKSCFARSTVVFLEEEDPKHEYRERIVFSINLPNFELKRPWNKEKPEEVDEFGRTSIQATWDDSVNALARIVESTGLKPKYCKNDRHYGRFVMKQDLRSAGYLPDEYFSFTLDYNTAAKIQDMKKPYDRVVERYTSRIKWLQKKIDMYPKGFNPIKREQMLRDLAELTQERDFFIGTTPDPHNLDEGLLFLIEVSTLKDYHIVKDRMQSIMTRYILHLSRVAMKEAQEDPGLEHELIRTIEQAEGNFSPEYQEALEQAKGLSDDQLNSLPEYLVDEKALSKMRKRKKAA